MKRLVVVLNLWRLLIPIWVYMTDRDFHNIIVVDLQKSLYSHPRSKPSLYWLLHTLVFLIPFRAIFYFRMRKRHNAARLIQERLLPNKREVEITGDIDSGLLIFHGQATIVHCAAAGQNLTIYQSVTVGRNPSHACDDGRDMPVIGDNVTIYTGSIVAGGITIGNNVEIGAGSVVMKDVPDDCVVVGNPARIIKRNGQVVNEPLIRHRG